MMRDRSSHDSGPDRIVHYGIFCTPPVPPLPHREETVKTTIAGIDAHKKVLMSVLLDVEAGQVQGEPAAAALRGHGPPVAAVAVVATGMGSKGSGNGIDRAILDARVDGAGAAHGVAVGAGLFQWRSEGAQA